MMYQISIWVFYRTTKEEKVAKEYLLNKLIT